MMLPIADAQLPTSGSASFGAPRPGHPHNGIDLPAPRGTSVVAPADGVVRIATNTWRQGFSGYGRVVVLEHAGPTYVLCAHLDSVLVSPGARVSAGELIGTVGNSMFDADDRTKEEGRTHLHFEVAARGYPMASTAPRVDPVAWLRGTLDAQAIESAITAGGGSGAIALAFALGVVAWLLNRRRHA